MSPFQTAWVDFKVPSFNVEALLETHRKNAAALSAAHQIAFDSLKALAQRQSELIKATVDDYSRVANDVLTAVSLEERAAKQADAARHAYVATVSNVRELSDMALKANVAAADILNARVTEAFDEVKALFAAPLAAAPVALAAPVAVVVEPPAVVEPVAVVVEPVPVAEGAPVVAAPKPRTPRRTPPRR